jgi:cell wall-associated NlpC family hydrolase
MRRTLPVLVAAAMSLTVSAEAVGAGYATRTLAVGSSGSDVRALQRYLDMAGYNTTADGQFGPATRRSVKAFESAEQRRVNGRASRAEQRTVRARATAAGSDDEPATTPTEKGYIGSNGMAVAPASAPDQVRAIIAAGNAIATKPYKYGGGHTRWNDSGYDCSGSVSYVLHAAGLLNRALDSTGFMSWGEPGRGTWVTVRTNPSHAYLIVAGLRFDTSALRQTGNR